MASQTYAFLDTRIKELAARFVDFDIPLNRDPTPHELDMIAAFKLLAHAEFETFIEMRVRETIQQCLTLWKANHQVTKALFGLILRWYPYFEKDKNPLLTPQTFVQVTGVIEVASTKAFREIEGNNSIKREAFSKMCHSAGLLVDSLSGTLLASLESYGNDRGEVAHNAVGKVRTLNDPRVEASYAMQIVTLLLQFDEDLTGTLV